jgi:DNA ligase-4
MYIAFNVSFERYFLFVSELTKKKLQEEIDEFSDSYYLDLDLRDIKQVLALVCVCVCVCVSHILFSFCVPWTFYYNKMGCFHYNL